MNERSGTRHLPKGRGKRISFISEITLAAESKFNTAVAVDPAAFSAERDCASCAVLIWHRDLVGDCVAFDREIFAALCVPPFFRHSRPIYRHGQPIDPSLSVTSVPGRAGLVGPALRNSVSSRRPQKGAR